jgi:hypothetical protein
LTSEAVLRSALGGVDRPATGSYTPAKPAVAGCTMPRWSPCSIRGKCQGKLRKPVRSAFDQANCDSRQKALKSISDSDLRRVSEWLAATLEIPLLEPSPSLPSLARIAYNSAWKSVLSRRNSVVFAIVGARRKSTKVRRNQSLFLGKCRPIVGQLFVGQFSGRREWPSQKTSPRICWN